MPPALRVSSSSQGTAFPSGSQRSPARPLQLGWGLGLGLGMGMGFPKTWIMGPKLVNTMWFNMCWCTLGLRKLGCWARAWQQPYVFYMCLAPRACENLEVVPEIDKTVCVFHMIFGTQGYASVSGLARFSLP